MGTTTLGNSSPVNARLTLIREDLKTQITDVFPSVGTILIIHPKGDTQFTPEYCQWLAETMKTILPNGVKGMILSENVTNVSVVAPDGEGFDYMRGWDDAVRAIGALKQ